MQPTAVDEALIGEPLRLSNARESWLGHSLLPAAPRGWPTTSLSSKSGEEYAGRRERRADAPRQYKSKRCWLSRHVAQSRSFRIAAGLSAVHRMLARVDGPGRDRVLGPKLLRDTMRYYANATSQLPASAEHGANSQLLGALVAAEQPIFGYNAWGLALFLSDLHLLPTGLLLSWVAAVPLILPGCPRSQRQVVAWAGDCAFQFIRRMAGRPLWPIVAVVVFEIFIPSLGAGTHSSKKRRKVGSPGQEGVLYKSSAR
ncbi:hypothetical protein TGAM01_v205060 [Trichoderma gamsii]|uniref:Uncharacterized protein n=1 Tax=Trichoderma gamsii TaxID=398673 RepID=A0A2P4ZPC2_9HYPO|nr:hypothetical protein TGAM01_v205060 [Trichoderma gamsii]PON26116.1 hypothetical protein TGAM01_v205060 [Trichoderma gamsii]